MGRPVVHFEIGCRDAAKTSAFYSKMFDWNYLPGAGASMIAPQDGKGIGGHIHSLGHEPHNYVTVYVEVDDLQAYLDKAKALGGRTLVPPVEIPGKGWFAWFADPEGTPMGLWKVAAK